VSGPSPAQKTGDGEQNGDDEQKRSTFGALRHPLVITLFSALIAGWLFPAFSRQWQDRQKVRDLKNGLVTRVDEATTRTIVATRFLVDRRSRAAQTTDERAQALAHSSTDTRSRASAELDAALERERDATATAYIALLSDWLVTRAVTRSQLEAYFPGGDLAGQWEEWANHVTSYVRLASRNTRAEKSGYVGELRQYLRPGTCANWTLLAMDAHRLNAAQRFRLGAADGCLTELLLERKGVITRQILDANVAGFSTSRSDLLHDLVPFWG
jgi:hypothetical protein